MKVQELDTTITQLEHRRLALPDRVALGHLESQLADLDRRVTEIGGRRAEVVARLADLQRQVDSLEARRAALADRMYGARGSAARDLQAMDEEVRHLALRKTELEDAELELMEEQEPLDGALADLAGDRAAFEEAAVGLRASLAEAEAVIEEELAAVRSARDEAFAQVPEGLARQYSALRARLGGVGAAWLVGNRCEGCHLQLPSVELDRIRRLPDDAVVTCDQCGRILVRAAASPSGASPSGPSH
jgi:hypothetical protein